MDRDQQCAPGKDLLGLAEAGSPEISESNPSVAIVGMACRFPGADNIAAFWRLLEAGENAVKEGVPGSGIGRVGALFPDAAAHTDACRFGAYLDSIDLFDAAFFRISPVEAQLLDPQQRLILETSWRALEDACIDPERLKDSLTGVYAGISNNDYRGLILEATSNATLAEPAASRPSTRRSVGSLSRCALEGRRWRWTPPAPHRWSRCTKRSRACSGVTPISRLRAG